MYATLPLVSKFFLTIQLVTIELGGIYQMSLLQCPECGHELSAAALACANCGRPTNAARPVVQRKVVVTEPRREGFPAWALIPIGLLAVILIFVMYLVLDRSNETNANIRVNTNSNAAREKGVTRQNVPTDSTSAPSTVTVPGPPPVPRSQSAVPGSQSMVSE